MIGIHKSRMPTYLCFDCIDDLKTIADASRIAANKLDNKAG